MASLNTAWLLGWEGYWMYFLIILGIISFAAYRKRIKEEAKK